MRWMTVSTNDSGRIVATLLPLALRMSAIFMAAPASALSPGESPPPAVSKRSLWGDDTRFRKRLQRLDTSLVQGQAPVHAAGQRGVVRGDESAEAGVADQPQQHAEDLVGGAFIEVAGRLVGEQQQGLVG